MYGSESQRAYNPRFISSALSFPSHQPFDKIYGQAQSTINWSDFISIQAHACGLSATEN